MPTIFYEWDVLILYEQETITASSWYAVHGMAYGYCGSLDLEAPENSSQDGGELF